VLLPFAGILEPSLSDTLYNSDLALKGIKEFYENSPRKEIELPKKIRSFISDLYDNYNSGSVKYFLDKTPRYYEILPFIQRNFPEAKIIILKRNPLAVLSSIIDTWHTHTFQQLAFYKRDILSAPFLLQDFLNKNKENNNVHEIYYEKLIENPGFEIEKIFDWIGLEYRSDFLNYSNNKKYHGKLGDPKGIKQSETPVNNSNETWIKKFSDPYWMNFFEGYSDFLGRDFLKEYGGYTSVSFKPTNNFSDFKFYCEHNIEKSKLKSISSVIKHLYILLKKRFSGSNRLY
jgi:Sulfotransferase family